MKTQKPPAYDVTDRIVRASVVLDRLNRQARGEELPPNQEEFSFTTNTHTASPEADTATR